MPNNMLEFKFSIRHTFRLSSNFKIFESLYENNNFKCEDVINLIKSNPSIKEINMNVKRKKV